MPARHGRAAVQPDRRQGRRRRPCRVYAPVGSHETLLAYLVRRLLENGANTSFVNRIADAVGPGRRTDRGSGRGGCGARSRRRAAPKDRAAARSLRARARQFGRPRPQQRSAARRARPSAGAKRQSRLARGAPGAAARGDPQPGRSARRGRPCRRRRRGRGRRRVRARGEGGAGVGRAGAERARAYSRRGGLAVRIAGAKARRPDLPRSGQDPAQRARRRARGGRFPALLRDADRTGFRQPDASPARHRRLHQPVELPDRDLHRPDRRGARRRQCRHRQAGGGNAADRAPKRCG